MGYPDTQPKTFPNQFSATIGSTSTVVSTGLLQAVPSVANFGFGASLIKMVIDGGGPAYINLAGAAAASTNDYRLTSGDLLTDFYDIDTPVSGIAIGATSTGLSMRLGAWG